MLGAGLDAITHLRVALRPIAVLIEVTDAARWAEFRVLRFVDEAEGSVATLLHHALHGVALAVIEVLLELPTLVHDLTLVEDRLGAHTHGNALCDHDKRDEHQAHCYLLVRMLVNETNKQKNRNRLPYQVLRQMSIMRTAREHPNILSSRIRPSLR